MKTKCEDPISSGSLGALCVPTPSLNLAPRNASDILNSIIPSLHVAEEQCSEKKRQMDRKDLVMRVEMMIKR